MILSICPNPSIDCTIELDSLNVGMLNKIDNKVETYSGKALNVAIGVARLNKKSVATGFMFNNHKILFENALKKDGVEFDFVDCEGSARVNYKIIDKKSMLTEINDKGEMVERSKQLDLIEKVKKLSVDAEIVVLSGSLPKGTEDLFYGEIVSVIPKDKKIILDGEKNCVMSAISNHDIFMVKPNIYELENFSGRTVRTKKDMILSAKSYIELGVKYVLISMGADGAILTDGKESYFCKSANVAVNSTVGAGDSMVSAAAVAITENLSNEEVLKRAVSAGTAAVTTSGTNLFYKEKYDEIYNEIFVEKI